MKEIDYLKLDGNSLKTFITVFDEKSVSKAAVRLSISQSAVSHALDKLREVFDDPLFVRSGRGICATEYAQTIRIPVQNALDNLKNLTDQKEFDPNVGTIEFTVAANDFQRALIFPGLLKRLYSENIDIKCKFIPSGVPSAKLLNQSKCDLLMTPFPPESSDIFQQKLFESELVCFYDSKVRKAPTTATDILDSNHVEIQFSGTETNNSVIPNSILTKMKSPIVSVSNFSAAEEFIIGTDSIAMVLDLMTLTHFKYLEHVSLPFETNPLGMFLVWHRRNQNDLSHKWLREKIISYTNLVINDYRKNSYFN